MLTAVLLLAPPAGAQPPTTLTDHLTDDNGVLTDSGRAAVSSAIDRLYRDRHIWLWVVYVDNFSRFKPENWADRTRSATGMGDHDALLAVATNTKLYTFTVPPQVQELTATELNSLRSNHIERPTGWTNPQARRPRPTRQSGSGCRSRSARVCSRSPSCWCWCSIARGATGVPRGGSSLATAR
jgi:hypothetical protein